MVVCGMHVAVLPLRVLAFFLANSLCKDMDESVLQAFLFLMLFLSPQDSLVRYRELSTLPYSRATALLADNGQTPFSFGMLLLEQGHLTAAVDWFAESYRQESHMQARAHLLFGLAWSQWVNGETGKALRDAKLLKGMNQEPELLARADFLIGLVYNQWGRSDEAQFHIEQSLAIYRSIDHKTGQVRCFIELAKVAMAGNPKGDASKFLDSARRLTNNLEDSSSMRLKGQLLELEGDLAFQVERYDVALKHFEQARPFVSSSTVARAWLLAKIGLTHALLGHFEDADRDARQVSSWNGQLKLVALEHYNSLTYIRMTHCGRQTTAELEQDLMGWSLKSDPGGRLPALLKKIKKASCLGE